MTSKYYVKNCSVIFLISISLIIQISSQLTFNFTVKDIQNNKKEDFNFNSKKLRTNLELPMNSDVDTKTIMKTCLGTPPQCFDLIIQTNSFYIMVPDNQAPSLEADHEFDYSKSTSFVKTSHLITFDFYGEKLKGQEASDILTLGDKKLNRTNFLIIHSFGKFRHEDGFIGLGYTPTKKEKKFSIIQQLYENGVIPHKVFSQKYSDRYNGQITIGNIPNHIVKDYMHYGRCKALNKKIKNKVYKNNNWECNIDFINYGENNESDDIKKAKNIIESFLEEDEDKREEVLFLSYRKRSFLPYELFKKFGDTYFKRFIDKNKCNIGEEDRYTFYECDEDVELEPLNFIFDSWEIRLESKQLFSEKKKANNKKEFIFYYKKKFEKILFGRSILKELEMVYDYANKQIGFYHKNVTYIGNEKILPPKVFDFLIDDNDFVEKNVKTKDNFLPDAQPEEKINKKYDALEQDSKTYLSDILKVIFQILIIIISIGIFIFLFIYGMKIKRKKKIRKANMHLKKERLMEMS